MGLEMVLNDLSLLPLAEDMYTARQRMSKLVEMLIVAVSLKVERALRTEYDINVIELAIGYPVARWMNDSEVDRDTRRYFRSLATKAPYLRDVNDAGILDSYSLSDFSYEQRKATGLGIAFLLDALAISFHSQEAWETHSLQLSLEQLQENSEIAKHIVSVPHACLKEHILQHRAWINKRVQVDIKSGADLSVYCLTAYPRLRFCASAIAQVEALPGGEIHLQQIRKHLNDLKSYCEFWKTDFFNRDDVSGHITEESEVTLTKYAQEHTFLCPDGEKRKFSWHCRVTPEPWRIYFFPLPQERLIIIGHIGDHLPTVKYPT
jgi:hypothetical protein